jgi:hypothetical protein
VDITNGKFVFSASKYMIEGGKITAPIRRDPHRQRTGCADPGVDGGQ